MTIGVAPESSTAVGSIQVTVADEALVNTVCEMVAGQPLTTGAVVSMAVTGI